jgi:transcription antitermination factor NusG
LSSKWYALGCKLHKERFVWKLLQAEGVDVFYPKVSSSGKKSRWKSFFPNYLFVRLDLDMVSLSKFNNMPHTNGLVSIEGKPFHVPDAMIEAIRTRINEINSEREKTGETGEISTNGLFSNLETLLNVERPAAERMTILNQIFEE